MTDARPPGNDVFTAADLAPALEERRRRRLATIDRAAAAAAVVALGAWAGGLVALGACAAPAVFELAPYPFAGRAMGAAFSRFDQVAVACGLAALACEAVRTVATGRRLHGRAVRRSDRVHSTAARVRRLLTILVAAGAVLTGVHLTPGIVRLHQEGARRGVGVEGIALDRLHEQAELIGKITVPLATALIVLHLFTVRSNEDDENADAPAPLPPGPRPAA